MLMESRAKFCSPPNTSGASQRNRAAAFSQITEAGGGFILKHKKTTKKKKHNMAAHSVSCRVQISASPEDPNGCEKMLFTPFF